MTRTWAVRVDGEIVFSVSGPDAEPMARAAARIEGGTIAWREDERPTAQNGYQIWGPWHEVA